MSTILLTKHLFRNQHTSLLFNQTIKMSSDSSLIEKSKKAAACKAIDDHVNPSIKVMGIGSGSTIVYAVQRLAERVHQEKLDLICIPSSFQSKQLLVKNNLKIGDLDTYTSTDLTIDGADEVDKDLTCIKGGGGCHLQEKLIAFCAKKFVIIADSRKRSVKLGQNWQRGVPLEVLPSAYKLVQDTIEKRYGGKAVLRESYGFTKAGPVISDNGNFIIDWQFETKDDNKYDWKTINVSLKMIPGVIETGLFVNMAEIAYFGNEDGTITVQTASKTD